VLPLVACLVLLAASVLVATIVPPSPVLLGWLLVLLVGITLSALYGLLRDRATTGCPAARLPAPGASPRGHPSC
jgi:hypothetical protein